MMLAVSELDGVVVAIHPSSSIDPYVVVLVHGVEDDYVKHKTEVVRNNGFNPTWNQTYECIINVPDQAVIVFTVKDFSTSGSNEIIGTYALPVMAIGKGN